MRIAMTLKDFVKISSKIRWCHWMPLVISVFVVIGCWFRKIGRISGPSRCREYNCSLGIAFKKLFWRQVSRDCLMLMFILWLCDGLYMSACIHSYIHTTYTCIYIHIFICVYIYIYIYVYVLFLYIHIFLCLHLITYTCMSQILLRMCLQLQNGMEWRQEYQVIVSHTLPATVGWPGPSKFHAVATTPCCLTLLGVLWSNIRSWRSSSSSSSSSAAAASSSSSSSSSSSPSSSPSLSSPLSLPFSLTTTTTTTATATATTTTTTTTTTAKSSTSS